MTDFIHPPGIYPSQMSWSLVRNQQRATSPYSGTIQRNDRGGDLWRCRLEYPELSPARSGALTSWLDLISKGGNAGLVPAFHNPVTDSFSETAALTKPWAAGELALWTGTAGCFSTLTSGYLRLHNFGAGQGINRNITVTANVLHTLVIDVLDHNTGWLLLVQSGGSTLTVQPGSDTTKTGRFYYSILPTGGNIRLYLYASATGSTTGEVVYGDVHLSRALEVREAKPPGSTTFGTCGDPQGPSSGQLQSNAGQFFTVETAAGREFKRLVKASYSIPSQDRNGVLVNVALKNTFEPPLRGSVTQFTPFVHHLPVCRMLLADAISSASVSAPLRSGFSIEMIETPT